MSYFNIRIYGLLINDLQEILLSDEQKQGRFFTKFPGGGLELGEGIVDCLKREYLEECNLNIEVGRHIYTTDFYEQSSFNDSQIVSIYYLVHPNEEMTFSTNIESFDFSKDINAHQVFRWKPLSELTIDDVTFKTDQFAIQHLKSFLDLKGCKF